MKVIAIHQPNFFPWLGYFDKIVRADVFVFLDHVVNNPRSAGWTKRVKIMVNKAEHWLTVPLKNNSSVPFEPISEMKINYEDKSFSKHLMTIEQNYKKATFFNETMPLVRSFYDNTSPLIAERNIALITELVNYLGISTRLERSSCLRCNADSTDMLIDIVRKCDGSTYLCGGGADGYQEDEKFNASNIKLLYQNYLHPVYTQINSVEFIQGLSIIDALMNIGRDGVKRLLNINAVAGK